MDFVPLLALASAARNALCLLDSRSLANTGLCGIMHGSGTFFIEGINALCDALKGTTTLTSLKYASQLESIPTVNSL